MAFPRVPLVRLAYLSCIAGISNPVISAELLTRYQYVGATYPSLHAAENALWNYPGFFGASYYTYQSTSTNGNNRTYYLPPTIDYFIDPMLVFSSSPGIACDDSPLLDQFGNN